MQLYEFVVLGKMWNNNDNEVKVEENRYCTNTLVLSKYFHTYNLLCSFHRIGSLGQFGLVVAMSVSM